MNKNMYTLIITLLISQLMANIFLGAFVASTFDEVQNNMQHAANVTVQTNQRSWNATKCIVNKMLNIR